VQTVLKQTSYFFKRV